jgi:lysophospholipase L1-like esterase
MSIRLGLLICLFMLSNGRADDNEIASMDTLRFTPPKAKGRADLIEGKFGKSNAFHFEKDCSSTFFTSNLYGNPSWDKAAGFSFWVKGLGHDGFAGLQFIFDENYAARYDFTFKVSGSEWTKIVVAWNDLIPVLPGSAAKPLNASNGNPPSKLSALWIGKWWYWGDYPALSFAIDQIQLEAKIERDTSLHLPQGAPLARVAAKLKAGQPITIVTMGDSLTDKRHWANRQVCWVDLVQTEAKQRFQSEIRVINPAIGGTQLRQNLVLIPKWLEQSPEPDLVTIFFGGNDWDSGMRGPDFTSACIEAIDRVRQATHGKTDVLLITTNPSFKNWDRTNDLAQACRAAAKSRRSGLADTRATFELEGDSDRIKLFVDDHVHLSRIGHEKVAQTVMSAILSNSR